MSALQIVHKKVVSTEELKKHVSQIHRDLNSRKILNFVMDDVTLAGTHTFKLVNLVTPAGKIDDDYYEAHKDLQNHLPRGMCYIIHNDVMVKLFLGMRKFGYDNAGSYKPVDADKYLTEYWTRKENGQCARVSAFSIIENGIRLQYLCIGSKKVAAIFRADHILEDILMYTSDRYIASNAIAMQLHKLFGDRLSAIAAAIDDKYTLVAESCRFDDPHIIPYTEEKLYFFAVSTYSSETGCTIMLPHDSKRVLDELGLEMVHFDISNSAEQSASLEIQYRNDPSSEGSVVYRPCGNDNNLWVRKVKSNTYATYRAVREMMKRHVTSDKIRSLLPVKYRVFSGNDSLPAALLNEMLQFNAWCSMKFSTDELWISLFANFPAALGEFYKLDEESCAEALAKFTDNEVNAANNVVSQSLMPVSQQLQFVAVGLPGCGKTTLMTTLAEECSKNDQMSSYTDQDIAGGNANIYHANAKKMTTNNIHPVFFGKIHHNDQVRNNLLKNIVIGRVIYLVFRHPDDTNDNTTHMVNECITRAVARVDHISLSPEAAPEVIRARAKELSYPETSNIIWIDITHTTKQQIVHIDSQMQGIFDYYSEGGCVSNSGSRAEKVEKVNSYPLYWSIVLDQTSVTALRNNGIVMTSMKNFTPTRDTHVTLLYQGGKHRKEQASLEANKGDVVEFMATHLASDDKSIAVVVTRDTYNSSIETTHITLGTSNKTKPVWSSTMLKTADRVAFNVPIVLRGVVTAIYNA